MKKVLLTSLMAVFAVSAANATNYFVGGSAAFTQSKEHSSAVMVAPEFGYKYDNAWDFGVDAKFGYANDKYIAENKSGELYAGLDGAYEYGAGVFARYKVAQFGNAKLLLKGRVGADFTTFSSDMDNDPRDGETAVSLNATVSPMVTYDISESFTLYADLNFLGIGAGYDFENKDFGQKSDWYVGGIMNTADVANTEAFKIGFFYNF